MILAAIILTLAQTAPATPRETAPAVSSAPSMTVGELRKQCMDGTSGDDAAMVGCQESILKFAEALKSDSGDAGTCMSTSHATIDEVTWTWLDWVQAKSSLDAAPAAESVLAAILDKYPCGWEER